MPPTCFCLLTDAVPAMCAHAHGGVWLVGGWLQMADELTLNFVVGLGSTAIIFYGVMLQGRWVRGWMGGWVRGWMGGWPWQLKDGSLKGGRTRARAPVPASAEGMRMHQGPCRMRAYAGRPIRMMASCGTPSSSCWQAPHKAQSMQRAHGCGLVVMQIVQIGLPLPQPARRPPGSLGAQGQSI